MPFFMVDDQLHVNRKAQMLIDMGPTGLAAMGLWTLAGSQCQAQLADGHVADSTWRLIGDRRLFTKLAGLLVVVGLWEVREDGWQYHDWADIGYQTGAKVRMNRKRTKEMKDPAIVEAVKARDGDRCRYCGRRVDWKVRNADHGATYDHVIPGLARGATNLVVSCRKCNQKKAQRTPDQAGMTLLPSPFGPDSGPDKVQTETGPDGHTGEQRSAGPHKGRDRVRAGFGSEPGNDKGQHAEALDEDSDAAALDGPAGACPPVADPPGHTGSPWHNWHGTPPPHLAETRCATHGHDLPCAACTAAHYDSEAR